MIFVVTEEGEQTMSDKQKLLEWLNQYDGRTRLEDIIFVYMAVYSQDFSAKRINDFLRQLNLLLANKINNIENATRVAHERATYLKCYLEGKMYENEEAAKQCVGIQIENAQAILDSTERVAL